MKTKLITPYGGRLVNLLVPRDEREALLRHAGQLPSLQIPERAVCDLELLLTGAFSPLTRFMGREDYQRVLHEMRLADGRLFPIPVTLPVEPTPEIKLDTEVALRDARNEILAVLHIEEVYEWDAAEAARAVLGTDDPRHPLAAEMQHWGRLNLSGALRGVQLPRRYDFRDLRLTPTQTRARLRELGRENVVAFQTRNPLHRAHEELTKRAVKQVHGVLLLHPAVGLTNPGDIDHYTRVRTYKALAERYYRRDRILLALIPLAMRLAGPREAVWHALIRRNYGANHLIVGRDHASPGRDSHGRPFYEPYAAQDLVRQFEDELQVKMLPFNEMVYLPDEERYEEVSRISPDVRRFALSGREARETYLRNGRALPEWYTRPEVSQILSESCPPRYRQGVCVWFTGLSGAGKSTTAEALISLLMEHGRQVTFLDGDVVRTHLSKGLGFSREDRDTNILRIGFVASEIVKHGGVVVVAAVSPYRAARNRVRALVGDPHFVEVFVDTPLAVCEARDPKGMYRKARAGQLPGFTGIDDPYEPPTSPEVVLDTVRNDVESNARRVLDYLTDRGFVRAEWSGAEAVAS